MSFFLERGEEGGRFLEGSGESSKLSSDHC